MPQQPTTRNVLAGLFVVLSLALGVVMASVLAARRSIQGGLRFTVRLSLEDGAAGLGPDAPVTLAGLKVGKVRSVRVYNQPPAGVLARGMAVQAIPAAIDVDVDVDDALVLYEDAIIALERPLLGSLSSLNIISPGSPMQPADRTPASGTWRIEESDVVAAGVAPPGFLAQAGVGPEQVRQIRSTIESIERTASRVDAMTGTIEPEVATIAADSRAILAELRTQISGWNERVTRILERADQASLRLDPMLVDVEASVKNAMGLVEDVRVLVRENRERIDTSLANVQLLSQRLNDESLAMLNQSLREGATAMEGVSGAVSDVRTMLAREGPALERTLANLRLMSDQLKLTSIEVRSQPWRLLIQPSTREFESQVLYDATRAYASAASDVRDAAHSLGALKDAPGLSDEVLANATKRLNTSLEGFAQAERALLDSLIANDK